MSEYVTLEVLWRFAKVTYYTVRRGSSHFTLAAEFMQKHKGTDELDIIRSAIQLFGTKLGAKQDYFKGEDQAHALPKPGTKNCQLRWYCLRINSSIVILFNGDFKTTKKALDCPNVGPHFRLANRLAKAIDDAIEREEIEPNDTKHSLDFKPGFELEI